MDSANSGSLQSSSGGDEEYDSRPDPITPFLNNNPSSHFPSISNHPPTLFDPSNLHSFSHQNTNPFFNLDLPWSRNLRSEPNFTDFNPLTAFSSSSSTTNQTHSLLGVQGLTQGPFPSPPIEANSTKALQSDQTTVAKNPKKRTRASRRAPTTVLTTDTTNFRQMVQEFTGIPAAPFSGTTYSRRLDLFGSGPAMRSSHLDTLGPLYPLRPSAQKVQPSPYAPSSSSSSPSPSFFLSPTSNTNSNTVVGASDLGLEKQSQSLLNMQNPILSFQQQSQSLLGVTGFHGSGDATQVRESDTLTRWRDGGEDQGHYGNNNNSSDFKGLENVSSRGGEGTVDSWICPSD